MTTRACKHSDPQCAKCRARRNRSRGLAKQREFFKRLQIQAKFRGQMANEEMWGESPLAPGIRWEVKSGKQIPKFLENAMYQISAARKGKGSLWVPGVGLVGEGSSEFYVVLELEDFLNTIGAYQEVGDSAAHKTSIRTIRRVLDEMERKL